MSDASDSRQTGAVQTIDFHSDKLVTFLHEGTPRVAMRRVVENLGMNWGSQHTKLAAVATKFDCRDIATVDAAGRSYPMMSMPIAKLPLWLATINPNKIPDPVKRAKIELYQEESAIALHDYWAKGVALNRPKLDADEEARENALNQLRQLRLADKALWRKLTDSIVATSYDYEYERENNPQRVKSLFARVQDTFHVAVCGKTAKQLVLDNVDAAKPLLGMTSFAGDPKKITLADVNTGKNYLSENPFRRLENLYEQLFLFAEQQMLRGGHMTLLKWEQQLAVLLRANGYEAFNLYTEYIVPRAEAKAKEELRKFKSQQRLSAA